MERPVKPANRTGQIAIVLAAVAVIALIWVGGIVVLRANRAEVEAHAAAEVANEALLIAGRMNDHLGAIDRTLTVLERDWEAHPDGFDLPAWRQRTLVLADASLQVFITDADGVVRQATDPALTGENVADSGFYRHLAALSADDGQMFLDQAAPNADGDGWTVNIARRLDLPDGSFAGVINATYDMVDLIHSYGQSPLGSQGLIELLSEQDRLLLAAEGGGARPGQSIADSAMWRAVAAAPDGRWIGPSAPDNVERLHAFHELPDQRLDLVVGMAVTTALRPARDREMQALIFVSLTTLLVMLVAAALLVETWRGRKRVATLAREQAMLAAAKADADAKTQRLEVTLAGMSDGVMMMDAELRLVAWNHRFAEMIGIPPSMPVRGKSLVHILRVQAQAGEFGPVDVEAEVATRIAAIRSVDDAVTTERIRPDGRAISVRRRRLADGSFVTIYTDITERKRNEDALRQARFLAEATAEAKSRFVAMVSHEIRQPLNALLNSLSLLSDDAGGPSPRRLVETARQSGDALLGLVNDILELSKIEAGQLALRPVVFALSPLLQGVLDMFADQAAIRGITLALAIADGTPDRLRADPLRIRQILTNLIGNAVKFASPGRVVLAAEAQGHAMLRLTIRDPGPVIDPAGRARLFEPFVQLGDAGGGGSLGTGLGLAICQTLAQLLGGEIGYDPTEDGGNTFWVRVAFEQPATDPAPAPAPARPPIYPRSRVLLVEDIRNNQLVIATLLRREGHMVDVAASGSAAIRAVAVQPYDLVLMDIFMPGMTGIEATRHIRTLPSPAGAIPICALTGNVSPEDRARCEAAGMNDMLAKPVELGALIDVLGRLVWRSRQSRQPEGMPESPADMPVLPLVMARRLTELRANLPPAMLADLVEQSIAELTDRLAVFRGAVASGNDATIEAEAHALAGLAGNYAMTALEFRLQAIVEMMRGGAGRSASVSVGLEDLLARSTAALRHAVSTEMA